MARRILLVYSEMVVTQCTYVDQMLVDMTDNEQLRKPSIVHGLTFVDLYILPACIHSHYSWRRIATVALDSL